MFEPPLLVRIGVGELVPALIRFSMEPSAGLVMMTPFFQGIIKKFSS